MPLREAQPPSPCSVWCTDRSTELSCGAECHQPAQGLCWNMSSHPKATVPNLSCTALSLLFRTKKDYFFFTIRNLHSSYNSHISPGTSGEQLIALEHLAGSACRVQGDNQKYWFTFLRHKEDHLMFLKSTAAAIPAEQGTP